MDWPRLLAIQVQRVVCRSAWNDHGESDARSDRSNRPGPRDCQAGAQCVGAHWLPDAQRCLPPHSDDAGRRRRCRHRRCGLAELDTSDLAATLQQLRGDAAVVQKRLEALHILEPEEVHLAETVRDQAAAQADLAQRTLERGASLRAKSLLPEQEYEALGSEAKVGRARLANAEASLNQVKARFKTDITTLSAQLNQASAAIRNAEIQIEWGVIRAPFDGIVYAVHQRPGELSSNQPGSPVLTLLKSNELQVHLYVDEADFSKVQSGQEATLQIEAHAGERVTGKVVRLLPQPILQENVVYYLALVDVNDAHRGLLRAEMTTLAYVQVGSNDPVLWVPSAALRSLPDGWYIRRLTTAGPVETAVQIGTRSEGRVEIRGGVAEGTEVLLDQ